MEKCKMCAKRRKTYIWDSSEFRPEFTNQKICYACRGALLAQMYFTKPDYWFFHSKMPPRGTYELLRQYTEEV